MLSPLELSALRKNRIAVLNNREDSKFPIVYVNIDHISYVTSIGTLKADSYPGCKSVVSMSNGDKIYVIETPKEIYEMIYLLI